MLGCGGRLRARREGIDAFSYGGVDRAFTTRPPSPQLVALGTTASGELATKILHLAAQDDRLRGLAPHRLNVPVHEWVLAQDGWNETAGFFEESTRRVIAWLLDEKWSAVGVDLWRTFAALVNRLKMSRTRHGLEFLYEESEHIPGAAAELERVVFAEGFVRDDDPKHRWFRSWDYQIVTAVRLARFQRSLRDTAYQPAQLVRSAFGSPFVGCASCVSCTTRSALTKDSMFV